MCMATRSPNLSVVGPVTAAPTLRCGGAATGLAAAPDPAASPQPAAAAAPTRSQPDPTTRPQSVGEDPATWQQPVMEALASRWCRSGRTTQQMKHKAASLLVHIARCGLTTESVTWWCLTSRPSRGDWGPAAGSTAYYNQVIARAVLNEAAMLGAQVVPDAIVGTPFSRPARKLLRPLDDAQMDRVRDIADAAAAGSKQLPVVALASAGGSATGIARVSADDIDLDAAKVTFSGTAARAGRLDEWSAQALARHLGHNAAIEPGVPVCIRTRTTPEREVESVSRHLRRVLRAAGLYQLEGVSADSIRLHAANRVLNSEGIVAAARFLGWKSLDRTADALGHHWRHHGG